MRYRLGEADLTLLVILAAIPIRMLMAEVPMAVTGVTPMAETLATSNAT